MLHIAIYLLAFLLLILLLEPFRIREGAKSKKKPANIFGKKGAISKAFTKKGAIGKQFTSKGIVGKIFKPKKPKPKKPVLPKPVEFASYADNVKAPYEGTNFNKIKSDVKEYGKALDGNVSNKLFSKTPLGMLYFYNTGTKCKYDGKEVDRHILIDSRSNQSMFDSADANFNQSMTFNIPDYNTTLKNECAPVTIKPVNVYGQIGAEETRYVSTN